MQAPKDDVESLFKLDGKTVIVTGAASGLGRAIAVGIATFNGTVVVSDIDESGAEEVADYIGSNAVAIPFDVRDLESIENLKTTTIKKFGSYEVVFNIPGINVRSSVFNLDERDWQNVIDVNLTGMYRCAKVLGPPLVDQSSGRMINMASIRGIDGGPYQSAYSASKAGVIQLTKVLAAEWSPDVLVNAIAPGYMKTPLVREGMADNDWYERIKSKHLLNRFGEPWEIIGPAVFLASQASSFMTGSVLVVDGGWTAV